VYNYGWLRFSNDSRARTYKLQHGKDYAIVWSRRSNNWAVMGKCREGVTFQCKHIIRIPPVLVFG
jgi:hypothetical protein